MTSGIKSVPADLYHADAISDKPTLSASIAAVLCSQSPRHAWFKHPKLNPAFEREDKPHFDLGTIVHQLLLEGHTDSLVPIDAPDWRTKAAQEARYYAYVAGKTPILTKDLPRVTAMVDAVREQMGDHAADPPLFTDGDAEPTLVWDEDGVTCRARLDWLRHDRRTIDDLKTTGKTANPEACTRNLFSLGYDVKAAFYLRGVKAVTGATPEFRWCFVETAPPHAVSVIAPGPDVLALGAEKVQTAIDVWRECLSTDTWPAYTTQVAYAEVPGWAEAAWLEREYHQEDAA